jgi:hypothetical protein
MKSEGKAVWTAPKLVELSLGMKDVENFYLLGSDGSDPGPPDVSSS